MLKNLIVRKGIIRGQTIVLEGSTGLPEGLEVLVGVGLPQSSGEDLELAKEELARELEAEEALQAIHRMRHTGRSVRVL